MQSILHLNAIYICTKLQSCLLKSANVLHVQIIYFFYNGVNIWIFASIYYTYNMYCKCSELYNFYIRLKTVLRQL